MESNEETLHVLGLEKRALEEQVCAAWYIGLKTKPTSNKVRSLKEDLSSQIAETQHWKRLVADKNTILSDKLVENIHQAISDNHAGKSGSFGI